MVEFLFFVSGVLLLVNLASIAIAAWRLDPDGIEAPAAAGRPAAPPVSIVIPVRGIETFSRETLASAFRLEWDEYELIFCVADRADPIVAAIEAAMAAHPWVAARVLFGDDRISANPKLNNCVKGWRAARHDWVAIADSNVLMPKDFVRRLMAARRTDTGLVCSTPLATRPGNFWAEVECAFLNTHQVRWQYAGEALGFGFAQGKTMLWSKPLLDAQGGIEALAADIAEDAAATKLVHRLGLKVHLVSSPFAQPLGRRSLGEIWARQARWARLRRVTFPAFFAPEILLGALPPLVLVLAAAAIGGISLPATAAFVLAAAYLPELLLARAKNWRLSLYALPALLARDLVMPVVWLRSWVVGRFEWRGNPMTAGTRISELGEAAALPAHRAH
ncbi:MAG: glycosyltransferase [Aquamicrobium sp.]|uniref:glycosyltransferase n=1 Tax=Aquamicrobium sp. TaxID=1872579 RepID=UPI00349E88B7|nr:glycosyltransferase [Aquamicrobium sp.]